MCGHCVMENVKERMLSRRNFFRGTVAAAGAAALEWWGRRVRPSRRRRGGSVDMTHELSEEFPTFGGVPGIRYDKQFDFAADGYNLYTLSIDEHTGTHIDAPLHFSPDGQSVAEIPVESLACPLCVIDIRARAAEAADAQVTPDDLTAWIAAHGDIPDGACVAMNSGWADKVGTDAFRGADGRVACISRASTSRPHRCCWNRPAPWPSPSIPCRSIMARRPISPPTMPGCLPGATGSNVWQALMRCPHPGRH